MMKRREVATSKEQGWKDESRAKGRSNTDGKKTDSLARSVKNVEMARWRDAGAAVHT